MLDALTAAAGRYEGENTLHDPTTGRPETTPATATLEPLMEGRFVRMDYTWRYQGRPQSGSFLLGARRKDGVVTAHWIDSWHNGESVMACEGTARDGGLVVRGAYPAPTGPDWGWTTAIDLQGETLTVTMHNVSPDGAEEIAVEARYNRVAHTREGE